MSDLSALIQLIAFAAVFVAIGAVRAAPMMLSTWASDRRQKFEDDLVAQSEIARKVAIAEAAIEARKRGEKFVPPDDYAR